MSPLRRAATPPRPVREALAARCRDAGIGVRVLAAAAGPDTPDGQPWVVALPTHLAYGVADGWTLVAWQQVDRGSWNAETSTLEIDQRGNVDTVVGGLGDPDLGPAGIVRAGGRRHRIGLVDPLRVPEAMSERVAATILFQRQLKMPNSRGVITVTARRNLADQTIEWLALPGRGVKVDDPEVRSFAVAALRKLSQQYG